VWGPARVAVKFIGGVICQWCEGTKFVSLLRTPHEEKFILPCPQEKLQERYDRVMEDLGSWGTTRSLRDVSHVHRLRENLRIMFSHSTYVGTPCPRCNQTGYELRLVQTGPPERTRTDETNAKTNS
jgi:hypothetical protein